MIISKILGENKIHSFLLKHLFTNEKKHPHNLSFKVTGVILNLGHDFQFGERRVSQLLHIQVILSLLSAGIEVHQDLKKALHR